MPEHEDRGVALVDPLLRKIHRRGWDDNLAQAFDRKYNPQLRRLAVLHMEKFGLILHWVNPEKPRGLTTRRLELFENTLSDLWERLLGGLVSQYLEGRDEGRIEQEFVAYVGGVIRHLLIANARNLHIIGEETPAEIVRNICQSRRERTLHAKVAWAKFCLEHKVRAGFLFACSREQFEEAYANVHHVSDYFFERFVLSQCETLGGLRGDILSALLERLRDTPAEFSAALPYIGTVTPFPAEGLPDERYLAGIDEDLEGM
jgi:hypothetical protein